MPMSGDPFGGAAAAPDPEERDLLRRLQSGEREGLARLIDRYGEALMQYLYSILRNRDEAEEAFQDTWVRVTRKIHRCDADRPFAPWLFRVARNRALDRLRRRRRWSLFSLGEPGLRTRPDHRPVSPTVERRLVAEDLAEKLLPRLDAASREVIWLRFYGECSYLEIAEICDMPLGTVKSRLRRALDRLGSLYEGMEGEHDNSTR
jgi:RNA polymerase sigma-70 factor (ECF subfamily)